MPATSSSRMASPRSRPPDTNPDLLCAVTDAGVQLHGGYGYTREDAIGRAWVDARITKIYAGTNEIMKELIGRTMGL
jgi:acyl-CoA dehydrogenase